jgi:hypothetical protein
MDLTVLAATQQVENTVDKAQHYIGPDCSVVRAQPAWTRKPEPASVHAQQPAQEPAQEQFSCKTQCSKTITYMKCTRNSPSEQKLYQYVSREGMDKACEEQ